VKTKSSERMVRIHPALRRLGLLDRVAILRSRGEVRLFPELARQGTYKKYSDAVSKWFTRYRRQIDLYEPGKDFHSLRQSFTTFLHRAGAPQPQVAALLGHKEQGETGGRYHKGFSPAGLAPIVGLLNYGIAAHRDPSEASQE